MPNTVYFSKTALTGGTASALDYIDGAALADGDWAFVDVSNVIYLYKLDADSAAAESSPSIIAPDTNAGDKRWILKNMYPLVSLPAGHISGLAMSHAADTEHDITVAAGKASDATDAANIALASAITKRFDAEWSAGSTNGGFATGEALPASGTIHVWLIKRSDTGVVDVMANNNATTGLTPTLPAGYDYKRLIGSYRTDGSNNIINGTWWGTGVRRRFEFLTPILDVSANPGDANAHLVALSVPSGIKVIANIIRAESSTLMTYISSTDSTDMPPSSSGAPLNNGNYYGGELFEMTNISSQVRYRLGGGETQYIVTKGYEMSL